jgi:hypothetical protein
MTKNGNGQKVRPISDMLQDPSVDSKPEIESSSAYAPTQMNMKQHLMLQAFQVFMTQIIGSHGNVSIMARKQQLAQSEINNALLLTQMVGDSYEAMVHKPD